MAKQRQTRASKTPRRKATTSKVSASNGNGAKTPEPFDIGTQVALPEEDAATLESAENQIASLQMQLGALLCDFEAKKALCVKKIEEAQKEYHILITGIGRKHDITLGPGSGQDWRFMPDKKTYERVA
jgi:hypothetical protein